MKEKDGVLIMCFETSLVMEAFTIQLGQADNEATKCTILNEKDWCMKVKPLSAVSYAILILLYLMQCEWPE